MWTFLLTLAAAAALVQGHGRVLDPPGRGSMWRVGFNTRPNYDDDALYCGGFHRQHGVNGGKCGICGDAYDAPAPRDHERGGRYDFGLIGATYEEGSVFTATVEITAHHLGYWEFKLCPDPNYNEQDCFDRFPVELEEGGTKYYPERGSNKYLVNYRLPAGLTCENCVLQWRYTCGNNWGVCSNGTQGLGCGPQETFGACSDITITGSSNQYYPADSLLLENFNKLGLIRVLMSGFTQPNYHWVSSSTVAPQKKLTKKRRKHKGKKKVKPYKSKWASYWRQQRKHL